jgi:hypothetical protein
VRLVPLLLAAAVLTACGGAEKPDAYARANTALLETIPVYPGATSPTTSAGVSSATQFAARDWTLPARTDPETVVRWYIPRLQKAGWKVVGKNLGTLRALRRTASLDVGVRGRTLEAIVDSRGHPG